MEDAQDARLEVLDRARDRAQRAVEAERHRVDGHVAAAEVLLQRGGLDLGQRARARVALAARAGEVDRAVAEQHARGAEAVVRGRRSRRAAPRRRRASPSTTRSTSRGRRPSSRSRTAPPTTWTPSAGANASSAARPARQIRSASMASRELRTRRILAATLDGMFSSLRGLGRLRWVVLAGRAPPRRRGRRRRVVLTRQPGDVSNPDVEFTQEHSPPPCRRPPPRMERHPFDDGFSWPMYGYTKQRTRWLPAERGPAPPFVQEWALTGKVLHRVPAGPLRPLAVPAQEQRRAVRVVARERPRALEAQARRPRGGLAGVRPRDRLRGAPRAREGHQGRSGRRAWTRRTAAPAGRGRSQPRVESSPLLDSGRLYFGSEDGTVYALRRERRRGALALQGERRGQGRPRAEGRQALLRRLRRQDAGDPPDGRPAACGRRAPAARGSASAAGGSTRRPRSRTGGSTSAASTASSTRSRRATASSRGGRRPAGTCTRRPPWRRSGATGPTVYIGSYDGKLYASNARSGKVRWTRNSGGKISGGPVVIGDLVFYSNLTAARRGRRRPHRPDRVEDRPRRVQPGDLRRPADLPRRLLEPVQPRRARPGAP